MRIGVISDLHIDRGDIDADAIEALLTEEAMNREIDLLLIAGDVSSHYQSTIGFLEKIRQRTGIEVLFVPGNHDYWQQDSDGLSAYEIYQLYREMPGSLLEQPYIINDDWAIVGHSGWYDYTYADSRFSEEKLARGKFYGGTWQDKLKIDWRFDDRALSKIFADKVREDLEAVEGRNIILMTHVVTHRKHAVPLPHRLFDYFNAFIGTSDFDELYEKHPIRYSIMGHIHFRNQFTQGDTTYICACLGYRKEWRTSDPAAEIRDTLKVIEI